MEKESGVSRGVPLPRQLFAGCGEDICTSAPNKGEEDRVENAVVGEMKTVSKNSSKSSLALQMSQIQANFAEKTANDMEEIVRWYAKHGEKDRFISISQNQSLPHNPLSCVEDDQDGDEASKGVRSSASAADTSRMEQTTLDLQMPSQPFVSVQGCAAPVGTVQTGGRTGKEIEELDILRKTPPRIQTRRFGDVTNTFENRRGKSNPTPVRFREPPNPLKEVAPRSTTKEAQLQKARIDELLQETELMAGIIGRIATPLPEPVSTNFDQQIDASDSSQTAQHTRNCQQHKGHTDSGSPSLGVHSVGRTQSDHCGDTNKTDVCTPLRSRTLALSIRSILGVAAALLLSIIYAVCRTSFNCCVDHQSQGRDICWLFRDNSC